MSKQKLTLKSKGYRTITHVIPTDDDAVEGFKAADEALTKGRLRNLPPAIVAELEQARTDAEAKVRDTSLIVKMRALPQHEFAKLKAAHPPTDPDHEEVREQSGNPKDKASWHKDTFGPALVAACMIEPETVTVAEATRLKDEWNGEEWAGLFLAALQANQQATRPAGLVFS